MNPSRAAAWLLLATWLAAPLASASPKTSARRAFQLDASASTTRSNTAALSAALERQLAEAGLAEVLAQYDLAPSIVQLRNYVEAHRRVLVCVVDISLRNGKGVLLATVRGNASASRASSREVIDSATRAAVARLPQALQALRGIAPSPELAQARRQWELPAK